MFFNKCENPIKDHGNHTQNHNGHQYPGKLEEVKTHSERKRYAKIERIFVKMPIGYFAEIRYAKRTEVIRMDNRSEDI